MSKQLRPAVSAIDHAAGDANAPIEIVEYGDYQCPHCGRAHPIVKQLQKELGNELRFVFRNFPLDQIHPQAFTAAVATEAAARQGKFWEMHDIIFENQERLAAEDIFSYAKQIGIDLEKFAADIQLTELSDKVEADFESGLRSGVNATPSFFVNGQKFNLNWDHGMFLINIRKLLEEPQAGA